MNIKKNATMLALIYLVILIAYNLVVFLAFNQFTTVFWISYGFMLVIYIIHICCSVLAIRDMSVKALFLGIPLLSLSTFFVCAEFFCSLVFMIFQTLASAKVAILIQALLICAFIVIAIISVVTKDTVESIDNKIRENVNFIKGINIDIEMLMQRCSSADVMTELKKLSETIKYSDPMTQDSVSMQENMIMQNMIELRSAFDSGSMDRVKEVCQTINLLFIERNKKLMISK
jgi:hypothetical protein